MQSDFGLRIVERKLLEKNSVWFGFGEDLKWFIWWYFDLSCLWVLLTMVTLWVYGMLHIGDFDLMSLYTRCFISIPLMLTWISVWFGYVCFIGWSTSCAVLWVVYTYRIASMVWLWVVYAHRSFIVDAYSDLWLGLVTCFADFVFMLRRDIVTRYNHDGGPTWLTMWCWQARHIELDARFSGCDHDVMIVPCV